MSKNPAPEKHFPIKKNDVMTILLDFGRNANINPQLPKREILDFSS